MNVSSAKLGEQGEQTSGNLSVAGNSGAPIAPPKSLGSEAWAGFYEGHFILKNHGHEQRVHESFAVWRSGSTSVRDDGVPMSNEEAALPSAVEAVVQGMGCNAYGKFLLRGAMFVDGCLRLERRYAVSGGIKRAGKRGIPRERRLMVPLVARSSTRERRATVLFDNSAPSPDHSCNDESNLQRRKSRSESPKRRRACKDTFSLSGHGDESSSDSSGNDTSNERKPSPQQEHDLKRPELSADSSDDLSSEDGEEIPCQNWHSATVDEDSDEVYEGDVCPISGLRHGIGAVIYIAHGHRIYEGEWRQGREHGRGAVLSKERRIVYDGEFADGKLHGHGVYYLPNGAVYSGEFRENMKHGFGRYALPEKSSGYVGEWRDNARHGRGRFQGSDSSSYDGEWAFDKRHGKAALDLSDGSTYDGHWTSGNFEGRGSCIRIDGIKYEGMWRNGRKEGRGSLQWPNGASYEGRFRDDKIDGQGALLVPLPVPLEQESGSFMSGFSAYADRGWLLPIELKADMARVHMKAGFDEDGF